MPSEAVTRRRGSSRIRPGRRWCLDAAWLRALHVGGPGTSMRRRSNRSRGGRRRRRDGRLPTRESTRAALRAQPQRRPGRTCARRGARCCRGKLPAWPPPHRVTVLARRVQEGASACRCRTGEQRKGLPSANGRGQPSFAGNLRSGRQLRSLSPVARFSSNVTLSPCCWVQNARHEPSNRRGSLAPRMPAAEASPSETWMPVISLSPSL